HGNAEGRGLSIEPAALFSSRFRGSAFPWLSGPMRFWVTLVTVVVMRGLRIGLFAIVFSVYGCATYESELQRGEEHFTHDEHEAALATFRALEGDWTTLSIRDRARYCYLRGMTDYRLGFKADARHWLAVAAQIDKDNPGALAPSEKNLVSEKLG